MTSILSDTIITDMGQSALVEKLDEESCMWIVGRLEEYK